ncbi:autotransporter-associated beta strand repeat-containing protein [Caulobacter sp. 17J80-11]|uniref:autotransporter-associated beta strand repeat-containing protein n=1 Tax=Caulobacter sp. 17J80-11 TaxID=2763502 RepID=UPI001653AD75|nr:autotransporter-associated beta strand repeat-containing protein [Caulobacter sp. 17J80-11]MBC6982150.1 autotransporter-associated beta strand repeat-containing protein [Caulobacter sp. 17J80-11]
MSKVKSGRAARGVVSKRSGLLNRMLLASASMAVLGAAGAAHAQSLSTTYAGGNNQAGNLFDIQASTDLLLTGIDQSFLAWNPGWTYYVYIRQGGLTGDLSEYTLLGSVSDLTVNPEGTPTHIPLTLNYGLLAGQRYGLYLTSDAGSTGVVSYTNGSAVGDIAAQNDDLTIYQGYGVASLMAGFYQPRIWNGTLSYAPALMCVDATEDDDVCAIDAATTVFGTGDALGGTDTLQLGGAVDFSFNADTLGVNLLNFEKLSKTGTSTVTLTGSAEMPVVVDEGVLAVAGTVTSNNANSPAVLVQGGGAQVQVLAGGMVDGGASSDAIYVSGGVGTVTNDGQILSHGTGVFMAGAGSVTNQSHGSISSDMNAVAFGGTATVTNDGAITSAYGAGVYLNAGGTVDNRSTGLISGATGINTAGGSLTLTNAGTITGTGGTAVKVNGGSITNQAGGLIQGGNSVFNNGAGALSVDNAGTLNGQVATAGTGVLTLVNRATGEIHGQYSAIDSQGGRIDVDNAGLIQGGSWGVVGRNAGDAIDNSGTIRAGSDGVTLAGGGELTNSGVITGGYRGVVGTNTAVDNQAGGYIVGGSYGVDLYGVSSLENAGTIAAGSYTGEVLTLGGYDGVRMAGGTLTNQAGGAIKSGAYAGVYSYSGAVSITNGGAITSNTGNGVYLRGSSIELTNQAGGTISGGTGVNIGSVAAEVTNGGAITATGWAVYLEQGGTLDNLDGATISGGGGVWSGGAGLTLTNDGLIRGTNGNAIFLNSGAAQITNGGTLISTNPNYTGVFGNGGGTLTNLAGGTISGGYDGVRFGGSATVDNAGDIVNVNTGRYAVLLNGGGSVTNREGGSIAGTFRGVYFGATGSVTNDGTISAVTDNAVSFAAAGTLTNSATGVITSAGRNSGGWGVWGNGTLSVDNAGRIDGESGVVFTGTGGVTNRAGGVIDGRLYGVLAYPQASTGAVSVDNAGTISGGTGVAFAAGGSVLNRAGGEIAGGAGYGVLGSGGAERVENAGDIHGGVAALDLGGGNDTLVMITGGTLGGYALGGAGTDALILGGAGEGSLDVSLLGGFESQTKIGDGSWTLTGTHAQGLNWSIEAGVLRVAGGDAIGDGATVSVAADATFALDADETIAALGGTGTVHLGGSTLTLGGDGADSVFDGVIVDGGLSFVGSWRVSDGPSWEENPAVLSGQEAAALLFGGQGADYSISTVSDDPNQIDYRAWMDGWGDSQYLYAPAPQNLHVDQDGEGYNDPGGEGSAYSAYVLDHQQAGEGPVNYAFRNEFGSLVKTGAGVLTLNGANTFSGSAYVQQGTLRIGGDERLSDQLTLWVESGATFDLQGYDETVKEARLKGTLAGTGTLTAAEYQLNGATVDANLGEGVIYTVGGVSTLNGTAGAGQVHVAAGTLELGDDERLDDAALVAVMAEATLDLGGFDETVERLQLNGTLAGTGTLSAEEYWLLGGTVDANLGEGVLLQFEGESLLNGLAGADLTELVGGSLTLGASERFDDAALVQVDEDATWALDGWDETIDQLWGEGVVDLGEGGSLTLGWDDGSSTFAGSFTGEGTVTKTGDGAFTLVGEHDFAGALVVEGGQVRMAAILAGDLHVNGGLLAGVGEIGGELKITGGTVSPGGAIGTGPARSTPAADLGVFFTNTLTVSGGTLNFGFAGADLDYASDHIVADGAIRLSGGVMDLHPVSALDQYGFNQQYLLIEGASLTGEFANLSGDFTANAYEGQLFQRLRYDVVPGGVVLEVRRMVDWSEFDPTLQGPVGEALTGTQLKGSDEWAGVLNTLLDLTPEERHAALEDMSGEGVANVSASTLAFGDRFQSVMQGHMNAGGGAGAGAGGGTAFAALPFGQGARSDVMGGMLGVAEAGLDNRPGGWAEAFVVDSTLKGEGGAADAGARGGGFATGADFQVAPSWRVGFALGFSDMQGDTTDRSTASEGRFWHAGAYASYSDGPWYGGAAFSRLTGDLDVDRQIGLGPLTLDVAGSTSVSATNVSINAGRRFQLSEATELRVGVSGTGSKVQQDGYTETGAGGLSLNVGEIERKLFVGEIGARVTRDFDHGRLKPYVGAGAAFAGGDLESLANVGFSGAPTGTGTFVVQGAELPSEWARLEAGVAFKPRENVWLQVGYDGSLAERLQEHRGTVKVSFKW